MAAARRLVTLGRSARTDAKVKVRQPLRRALLLHPGVELDEAVRAEIRDELNVRSLEDVDTLSGLMSWEVVPNFRALGPAARAAGGGGEGRPRRRPTAPRCNGRSKRTAPSRWRGSG